MAYVWANTIATGSVITASAVLEVKSNASAEVVARATSFTWTQMASCTSGSYIFAAQINEIRSACDLASASTLSCSSENSSEDTTVDTTANATANSSKNTTVDSGDDTSVNSGDDASYDLGDDISVDSGENATIYGTANSVIDSGDNATV
ncbi:MAG: hypothetical protein WC428_06915 [Candidatus Paceibacterota bacterium]